jgi:hypothetical protein
MMLDLNNNKGLVSGFEYITLACSKFPAQNVPVKMKVKVGSLSILLNKKYAENFIRDSKE